MTPVTISITLIDDQGAETAPITHGGSAIRVQIANGDSSLSVALDGRTGEWSFLATERERLLRAFFESGAKSA